MEDARYEIRTVGFIRSCFKFKNGTPRQPGICAAAQASLTISKEVYNNPEHSLEGLEKFSHVWVLFIFHKNSNTYEKAKVKPPRLNGAKVGVFSTRSPYRLNPIGLTLAKIERVAGNTLYLSGVDMLDGTPVVDVKPYIYKYDQPLLHASPLVNAGLGNADGRKEVIEDHMDESISVTLNDTPSKLNKDSTENDSGTRHSDVDMSLQWGGGASSINHKTTGELNEKCDFASVAKSDIEDSHFDVSCGQNKCKAKGNGICDSYKDSGVPFGLNCEEPHLLDNLAEGEKKIRDGINFNQPKCEMLRTANWIAEPPIPKLKVSFTPTATNQLQNFNANAKDENYKLRYITDAKAAIETILQADPRSTYRRTKCSDRLYFCVVDCMHVTAWFNDDDNIAEVLRVKPVSGVSLLQTDSS